MAADKKKSPKKPATTSTLATAKKTATPRTPKKIVRAPRARKPKITVTAADLPVAPPAMPPKKEAFKVTFKHAQSTGSNEILYRLRTFVGWSAFVAIAFAGLSMLSDYSTPGSASDLSKVNVQASVLNSDRGHPFLSLADKKDVYLTAVGDIMLARFTEEKMKAVGSFTYPFDLSKDILGSADLTFANLESPFFPGVVTKNESTTFRADPKSVEGLTAAGIDLVSLANNHTMNYQVAGLNQTLQTLKDAKITPLGAGQNITQAHTAVMIDKNGQRIAFLAYNDPNIAPRFHGEATDTEAGIAKMDTELLKQDIAAAKKAGVDFIIVSMHAGIEYRKEPTKFQADFAHTAIDAGASVVIGHHPHVVQSVERYNNGIIFYSLGNFVFDQLFSDEVKTGLLAKIILRADGTVGADLFPTVNEKLQSRVLEGQERSDKLKLLGLPEQL